jgi:hypothetical protein
VLPGARQLFSSFLNLNGNGAEARFAGDVTLAAGEAVDFTVGNGNGDYTSASTLVDAVVTKR